MIIRKIKLEPFGKFFDREYVFEPGLNVVLGPNEAGKTTLVNAIYAALFISPGVRRNSQDWKNIVSRYLPHPYGDTARVTLELADAGGKGPFKLRSAWGAEKEARLIVDGKTEISNEISINNELEKLLRHGRGTYEEVFLARQAELINTLDWIKEDQEALGTLADMLRAVIFQSGGISVDELENELQQKIKELENNWESDSDAPRGARDIDNPHRRNVGRILEGYYQVRALQQKLREAQQAEEIFESVVRELLKIESEHKDLGDEEKEMKKIEKDVNRRNALEPQLESYNLRQEQLKKITLEWPQKEERKKHLAEKKEKLEKEREKLAKELGQSQRELEIKKKRDIVRIARQLKKELDRKKEELDKLPSVTPGKMQELEKIEKELSGLKAEIGGMKLKIKLVTEEAMEVKIKTGLETEKILQTEGQRVFKARGHFSLEAPGWSIAVQSGTKDVEALLQRMEILEKKLGGELQGLGLPKIDEAREICRKRDELEGKMRTLGERTQDALKGHLFDDLEKELATAGEEKAVRDPVEINKDVTKTEFGLKDVAREAKVLKKQTESWQIEYGSYDKLLEMMIELGTKSIAIEKELGKLAPLPGKYGSAENFLEKLGELRGKQENLRKKLQDCRENRIKAEGNMPEESPEEIKEALLGAEKRLQDLKGEAAALRVVEKEFYELKKELDADTFLPFQKLFLEYLSPLTGHRYKHAQMQGALLEGIASEDGAKPLPLELLSYGTVSGVALALRLAMAHYLLQEEEGFMVMDDPLVDLDSERKKQAAEILRKAAETKQIIITTFDPHTAELLGGNLVEI